MMKSTFAEEPFSVTLERWAKDKKPKTLGSMLDVFDEKSFAFILFILLSFSALPIPTGGLTNVFEVIAMLIALQLLVGRKELWLPEKLRRREIPRTVATNLLPHTIKRLGWLEKYSKSRGERLMTLRPFRMQLGFFLLLFTIGAFVALPFSFLDTLPSIGVVLVSLGIILEDIYVVIAGYIAGLIGVGLIFFLTSGVINVIASLF